MLMNMRQFQLKIEYRNALERQIITYQSTSQWTSIKFATWEARQ